MSHNPWDNYLKKKKKSAANQLLDLMNHRFGKGVIWGDEDSDDEYIDNDDGGGLDEDGVYRDATYWEAWAKKYLDGPRPSPQEEQKLLEDLQWTQKVLPL